MKNNSILGIGSDVIEIDRVRKLIDRFGDKLLSRLFTEEERRYCLKHKDPTQRFAGRFAAKEAIAKALGKGFGKTITWQDISILPDSSGKPIVHLSSSLMKEFDNPQILITISHCKLVALSYALWQA